MSRPGLRVILREWGRLGCIGFGGPPAHIALLRELCVTRRGWLDDREFEDAIAATNLLPGPGSTQLAIYCAWRLRGVAGAFVGGLAFIVPGLVLILALAALFLSASPPALGARRRRRRGRRRGRGRASRGGRPGSGELAARRGSVPLGRCTCSPAPSPPPPSVRGSCSSCSAAAPSSSPLRGARPGAGVAGFHGWPLLAAAAAASGGLLALAWTAFKVGALSYGGGFVIIPLMQHDAVETYHWMTDAQFLNAVALGQVTPGPVVHTVAVVGYAAAGIGGGLLAAAVAFAPSFSFILIGADRFDRLRANHARARVPRRRRAGRDRRDRRRRHPARARARRGLAVRGPRRPPPSRSSSRAAASCSRWSPPAPSAPSRARSERHSRPEPLRP